MSKRAERPCSFMMIWAAIWAVVSTVARDSCDRPRSRDAADAAGPTVSAKAGGGTAASASAEGGASAGGGAVGAAGDAAGEGRAAGAVAAAGLSVGVRRSAEDRDE